MNIKVGDKVELLALGFSHVVEKENKKIDEDTYTVISARGPDGFIVEGGHYYDASDVHKVFTKENNPEYFL